MKGQQIISFSLLNYCSALLHFHYLSHSSVDDEQNGKRSDCIASSRGFLFLFSLSTEYGTPVIERISAESAFYIRCLLLEANE